VLTSPVNSALFEELSPDSQLLKYFCSIFSKASAQFRQTLNFHVMKHFGFVFSNTSAQFSQILQLNILKLFTSMLSKVAADVFKSFSSVLSNPSVPYYQKLQAHVLIASAPCFWRSKFVQKAVRSVSFSLKKRLLFSPNRR